VQTGKQSHEVAPRDQSVDRLQRLLGGVLELVLQPSFLRFTPPGGRRKHRVALRWASRRNGRIRNSSTGCHGGGDYRCSNRRVADRCRPLFACLPRPTLKYKIVAARICVLPRSLTAQRSSVDRIICIARFGGQSTEAIEQEQKAFLDHCRRFASEPNLLSVHPRSRQIERLHIIVLPCEDD
jgi:hypothetical protein